ncbi:MAG: hypothetical protein ABSB49_12275 [Polyangia bacterium]|jgi:type II secretory pathway component GspD/PulD (secretin)
MTSTSLSVPSHIGRTGRRTLFKSMPISIPSFGVLLQLLQNDDDVNILSSPDI